MFWLALRDGGARHPGRWAILIAASPVIAFELAVGGTDVPMVAFLCLGFALLWGAQGQACRPVLAGLALGVAAAMKATAWPAVAVAVALLAVRDGKRAVRAFILTVLAVMLVCIGPFLAHPRSLVDNTIKFPLGLASVTSQASSPLPGHVIADTGAFGHAVVVAALALAGLAFAASLVVRPPRSVPRAVALLAAAMTAHVRARSLDTVRLLHLPGDADDLAGGRRGRPSSSRRYRSRQVLMLGPPDRIPACPPVPRLGQRDDVAHRLRVVLALPGLAQVAQRLHVARPVRKLHEDRVVRGVA